MRKVFTSIVAVLLTASVFAQSPQKMSYQAVVRDANDNLVTSQPVGMQISILQGSASGTAVYVETQTPTTNANGLVSLEIGTGATSDDFSAIDWANGPYFIKTETDPTGGTTYTIIGASQLLSIPYALYAKTAESISGPITETDPTFASSEAANITATHITHLSNLSGTNTGDQDLSALASKTALADSTAQVRSEIPDVSGFVTSESDPVYTSSEAANITATHITHLSNLSGTNTGDQDLSALASKTALADSTAQVRSEISGFITSESDPRVPNGTQPGQMQYWDGTAWIVVAATQNEGATLQMIGGVPTWTGGTPPPPTPNVTNPTTGKTWMDRNLGASQVATSSTDANAYGDLYQWGRGTDGHEKRTSNTTTTLSSSDNPGHGNFILGSGYPNDWRNPQNVDLWQGVNGTNNPCPSGYRIPTEAEWEAERATWSSQNSTGAFASPLKLTQAGFRDRNDGSLSNLGNGGSYWSSSVVFPSSRYLFFFSQEATIYAYSRTAGYSVRCIKD